MPDARSSARSPGFSRPLRLRQNATAIHGEIGFTGLRWDEAIRGYTGEQYPGGRPARGTFRLHHVPQITDGRIRFRF